MGSIIGGVVSGIGANQAAKQQAKAADKATQAAMTGYNYLTSGAGSQPEKAYINAGQTALAGQGTTQNTIAQLLGTAHVPTADQTSAPVQQGPYTQSNFNANAYIDSHPGIGEGKNNYGTEDQGRAWQDYVKNGSSWVDPNAPQAAAPVNAPNAFDNYLNSTAYNFQLQQGQNAVNSNAAAKGLLNSGGTAKALTQYGQNLAGTTFNNYLQQLSGLNNQQAQTATAGQNALGQVASAGSTAGGAAANTLIQGGNAQAAGTTALWNAAGNAIGSIGNSIGGLGNIFGASGNPGGQTGLY